MIVFALVMIAIFVGRYFYPIPGFIPWIVITVFLWILSWGSYNVGSNFYFKVICKGDESKKQVAISFDDGPLPQHTPAVLDILKETATSATFFCIGKRAQQHPELLKRIIEEGHIIGNHSYSHDAFFDLYGSTKMKADLQQMNAVARQVLGLELKWFRPPYGVTNPNLAKAVKAGGFTGIGWNIRSLDTVTKDPEKLKQRVLKQLKPGAIILFHDTCASTVTMLPSFIQDVKARGYEIVPLDKLVNLQPYA